jgi:TonB family protein
MKNLILPIMITAILLPVLEDLNAQILSEKDVKPPEFPARKIEVHGQVATSIDEFLSLHVQYPPDALKKHLSGTEVIQFTVSTEGELSSIKVVNSISRAFDEEVIRVLETTSGNWTPGTVHGKSEPMMREIALVFKTNPNYDLVFHAKEYQTKGNIMMFLKEQPERALKYYNQAKRLLPYEESILANCCLCKYCLGDNAGAKDDLERILSLYPLNQDMHFAISKGEYFASLKKEIEKEFLTGY